MDSQEQIAKEKAIAQWIGLPARTGEDEDFLLMMETIEKRLKTKINKVYNDE